MFRLKAYLGNLRKNRELIYAERWIVFSVIIGVIIGIVIILFYLALNLSASFFLGYMGGYEPPMPANEEYLFHFSSFFGKNILILALIPMIGGLICGLIKYRFIPEAEGHGTDVFIDAFHNKRGDISKKEGFIRSITSILTIGSGGSAGREGPGALIGATIGSSLGRLFKLGERDRRELVACGASAGIASIFRSPLGGAFFGIETLYRRDIEVEALLPAIISSITAYIVFSLFFGFEHIYKTPEYVFNPLSLPFFALLGLTCVPLSILFVECLKRIENLFERIKIKRHFKPAIGGLLLGLLILFGSSFPPFKGIGFTGLMGGGYGFIQQAINGEILLPILIFIIFAKMIGTSFTLGSGGGGGLFIPSLVIGSAVGGIFGEILCGLFPSIITQPSSFVLVGMAAFFGCVANTPLTSLFIVCDITGGYELLIPSMLAIMIGYALTGRWTICTKQMENRARSPAHRKELVVDVLEELKVKDAMTKDVITIGPEEKASIIPLLIEREHHLGFPVIKNDELIGIVTFRDVEKTSPEDRDRITIEEIASKRLIVSYTDETLEDALRKLVTRDIRRLPVVDRDDPSRLLGMITESDIVRAHARERSEG